MSSLTGHYFAYNLFSQDYCGEATLNMMLDLCDEVVILDCYSTDGTREWLFEMEKEHSKLRIISGV